MKPIKILLFASLGCMLFTACKKDDFDPSEADNLNGLGGDTWVKGPIDKWIYDTLTLPYNIAVKYKWDQFEDLSDITKILVPVKEEIVTPILGAVNNVWIKPYIAEASKGFFQNITPKSFYLIGSPAYDDNNSIKLGQAEGGNKIILLALNFTRVKSMPGYVKSDSNGVKRVFQTIEHEFGHILHQNKLYPLEWKNLNPNLITSTWTDYTDAQALRDGFITAYAMNTVDDDFVEMIAIMLINGKTLYEKMIASIPAGTTDRGTTQAQAIARLRAKESIVVNYFKQSWGIDFYSLQARTRAAIEAQIY
jgi:substrate import-associated zinc metallohydrolase lipoprotein